MTVYEGPYYYASGCDSSARPGTDALMSWYLGAYRDRHAANLGTYACKRLGSGWSIHAERRAADLGTSPYGGVDSDWGRAMVDALRASSGELGIQLIILGHKVWSCRYPYSGWRGYTGDWHGHAHVELTPWSSLHLTTSKIRRVLAGDTGGTGGGTGTPITTINWRERLVNHMGRVDLSEVTSNSGTFVQGPDVKRLQGLLLAAGYGPDGLIGRNGRPDGVAGPDTRRILGKFQANHSTGAGGDTATPDYVAGKHTWSALLGV